MPYPHPPPHRGGGCFLPAGGDCFLGACSPLHRLFLERVHRSPRPEGALVGTLWTPGRQGCTLHRLWVRLGIMTHAAAATAPPERRRSTRLIGGSWHRQPTAVVGLAASLCSQGVSHRCARSLQDWRWKEIRRSLFGGEKEINCTVLCSPEERRRSRRMAAMC